MRRALVARGLVGDGRPESLQSYAERRIKTVIASGAFPPGSRLSPNLLAAEFGLSHIPIREALASLAAAGYVDHTPGRGYVTRQLSSADLADINRWRQMLEREAYLTAVPALTEEDITEMRRLAERMGRRTGRAHRLEYIQLNREFHFVAFRRAGSQRLLRLLNYLWDAAAPYASVEMTDSSESHAGHLAALPAFAARDTQAVITAMDAHRGIRAQHVTRWEAAPPEPRTPAPPARKPQRAARPPAPGPRPRRTT
jgi:DNA-binding GntR family transcriptional regulator